MLLEKVPPLPINKNIVNNKIISYDIIWATLRTEPIKLYKLVVTQPTLIIGISNKTPKKKTISKINLNFIILFISLIIAHIKIEIENNIIGDSIKILFILIKFNLNFFVKSLTPSKTVCTIL